MDIYSLRKMTVFWASTTLKSRGNDPCKIRSSIAQLYFFFGFILAVSACAISGSSGFCLTSGMVSVRLCWRSGLCKSAKPGINIPPCLFSTFTQTNLIMSPVINLPSASFISALEENRGAVTNLSMDSISCFQKHSWSFATMLLGFEFLCWHWT